MRGFGFVLFILGLVVLLYGCAMDVRAPGSNIVNLSLMQQQQLAVIVGAVLMVLGGIFIAVGGHKSAPAAKVCPHCGRDLPDGWAVATN